MSGKITTIARVRRSRKSNSAPRIFSRDVKLNRLERKLIISLFK